jgi:hypothetical protein
MTRFYVMKMVAVSTVVEAVDEYAAQRIAETIPVEIVGWDYEYDDIETVEETSEE